MQPWRILTQVASHAILFPHPTPIAAAIPAPTSMKLFPELENLVRALLQEHLDAADLSAQISVATAGTSSMSWPTLCQELLKSEPAHQPPSSTEDFDPFVHLQVCVSSSTTSDSRFAQGALSRPLYLAVSETLRECFELSGKWPAHVKSSEVVLLADTNATRLKEIEEEMQSLVTLYINPATDLAAKKALLKSFFFTTLAPIDIRPYLRLRTTTGSRLARMPPTLRECLASFVTVYERKGAQPVRKGLKPSKLTVGAKALTKHWHRDVENGFWGVATGTERAKNETANNVFTKILTNAAWINLHSLPHDITAYEIRNPQGYGVRWELRESSTAGSSPIDATTSTSSSVGTATASSPADTITTTLTSAGAAASTSATSAVGDTDEPWTFRGFLEPQMVGGHQNGWVH
ncbi:hypothetical protein BC937DRAFT_89082 [Endogone sp. FLAS-F59071]|nr:hypothetical protein BC937DRAFT_89082 [Endogone sp. FLAS-F59071]|eukprot:RUS18167.1 hypothetical protein BC937DRAFT_89082 [Endogone sp. FLAS-F59071]